MTARQLPYLPIVREALADNGLTPEDVLSSTYLQDGWMRNKSPLTTSANDMSKPFIMMDADSGHIDWGRNSAMFAFSYQKKGNGYSYRASASLDHLPLTAQTSLEGAALSRLINVAGADSYIITKIEKSNDDDEVSLFTLALSDSAQQALEEKLTSDTLAI